MDSPMSIIEHLLAVSPIAYIETLSVLACLAAIVFVLHGWKRPGFLHAIPTLLLILLVLMLFYAASLVLEWSGLGQQIPWHFLEDFSGIFIPFIWAFVFYALTKNTVEQDLRSSRRRFRNLVESTSDWIWEVDTKGRYTYVSPRVRRILGYSPDELLGKMPFDLMPPHEAARISRFFAEVLKNGTSFQHLENLNLNKDGREVYLETNGTPIFDDSGKLTGYRGIDRDITERKKVELEITRRQAEMDSIFAASPAGIALVRSRKLVHGNARFSEITGYREDALKGVDPRMLYLRQLDYKEVGRKYQQAREEGVAAIETRWVRADNTVIEVMLYISPLDAADSDKGFVVVVQDITELKAARQEATEEKTRSQSYLDVAKVMILVLDTKGRVKLINKKGCEILERSADEVQDADWFSFLPASYQEITRNVFDRMVSDAGKVAEYFENPICTPSGAEKLVAWHNAILQDESGTITGIISSGEDITRVRAVEQAARDSDQRLRMALSAAQTGTWQWRAATRQETRDANLNALLGLEAVETTQDGEEFYTHVHPDDRDRIRQTFNQAIHGSDVYLTRFRIVRADGQTRWVLDQGKPFFDFNGQLEYVTGVMVDITERQEMVNKLRDSEAALQKAQQIALLGFYDWDFRNDIVIASEGLRSLFGCEPDEELTFELVVSRIHPEDREQFVQDDLESRRQGVPFSMDYRVLLPDGTIRWAHDQSEVTVDEQGNKARMFGVIQDITERKTAEQQLRFTQFAIDHACEEAMWVDSDMRMIYVNDLGCQLLGYTREELLQMTIPEIDPNYPPEVWPEHMRRIRQEGTIRFESLHKRKDGKIFPVEVTANYVVYDGKEYNCAFIRDITERKAAEQQREELIQQLRFTQFAVDHAGEAAYWMGPDAKFVYVNEKACQSLGYTREELLSMTVHDIDPDFPAAIWGDHWDRMRREPLSMFESHHKKKDGMVFPVEITANFVEYEGREYNCAFARDISERKAAEQERGVLMEQLQERNDELQSIVFTTAHDLRSPLVNIAGFAGELEKGLRQLEELLEAAKLNKQVAEQIQHLLKTDIAESLGFVRFGSEHMDMLLNGLMRLSVVGAARIELSEVNMKELFDKIIEGLQYQIHEHVIDISVPDELPNCFGDFAMLTQVFGNLIDNAIKYRHPKRTAIVEIGTSIQDGTVEYTVTDNGIGIEPAHLEKVFELFHQLHPKQEQDGQGLGLTIVRRILDRLGGTVRIESVSDLGTTVHVRLSRA